MIDRDHDLALTKQAALLGIRKPAKPTSAARPARAGELLSGRYDDGGLSGASLDRPALQALFAEVRARRIDVVVAYWRPPHPIGRRFAKLIELLEANAVSFVSDTRPSTRRTRMGRVTVPCCCRSRVEGTA